MNNKYLFTSESVTEGHPDKMCDLISDMILDSALKEDPYSRVACETFIGRGFVIISGEIKTQAYIELQDSVRSLIKDIGYTNSELGFSGDGCSIMNAINKQSDDIAIGVDKGGAGDQGIMFGYATNETPVFMPMPIFYAHALTKGLSDLRKSGLANFLRPDGKSQVTVQYQNNKPIAIKTVLISTQHAESISQNDLIDFINKNLIDSIIPKSLRSSDFRTIINPTGRFVLGGPAADTGLTGRKIIVDTYGGFARHGGGAFSGKDPTKVDRSASYMARYIAKNLVFAGLCDRCEIQISYSIGMKEPISIYINTFNTSKIKENLFYKIIEDHFDLTPAGMIKQLNLLTPYYQKTASYGHFGRNGFAWERTDLLKKDLEAYLHSGKGL